VLCEKPFAIHARDAQKMTARARAKKVFLMEAMWTRFLPAMLQAKQWIKEGRIGEPRMVMGDFGFRADIDSEGRLFSPEFGGGSLLDVGVYPISFASMVFGGEPVAVTGAAHLGKTGVDEQAGYVLTYEAGRLAVLASGIRTETPYDAYVLGTDGMIRMHSPFWCTTTATLTQPGQEPVVFTKPHQQNGYEYQAMEVNRCIRAGELESPGMPLDETIVIMQTMDRLRAQWGLKYPMD
jgi:predicted dehydrogenase